MTIGQLIPYFGPPLALLVFFASVVYLNVTYLSRSAAAAGDTNEVQAACLVKGFLIILLPMLALLSVAAEKTSILSILLKEFYTLFFALILFLFAYFTHCLLIATLGPLSSSKHTRKDLKQFLPRFQYSLKEAAAASAAAASAAVDDYCVVCWECYKDDQWCRSLPQCKHVFHQKCIDKWLIKVADCPICRAPVRLRKYWFGFLLGLEV